MVTILMLVALGGALGGVMRVWLTGWVASRWGSGFPWGTLVVNVSGAFVLGLLAAGMPALQPLEAPPTLWLVLAVGALGSYTTVSSFSLQSLALLEGSRPWLGCVNIVASVAACLTASALGLWLGQGMTGGGT